MSLNNLVPAWMLGPCNFKQYWDGSPESTDWEICTVCKRTTRFRVDLMRQCSSEGWVEKKT